ncbi:MAG: TRAP transporter small permease [Comamonas sp.]
MMRGDPGTTVPGHRPPAALRWIGATTRLSGILVGIGTFAIALLVAYEVLARTFFGSTTGWVNDAATYLMGFITFGGAAYALAEGAHVGVDLVVTRVSPAARATLAWMADLIVFVVVALLAWLSIQFWWDAFESGEKSWGLFEVALWIPYSFFALGMLWLLVVHVSEMLNHRIVSTP